MWLAVLTCPVANYWHCRNTARMREKVPRLPSSGSAAAWDPLPAHLPVWPLIAAHTCAPCCLLPAAVLLRVIPAILYFLPFYYLAGFRTGALRPQTPPKD